MNASFQLDLSGFDRLLEHRSRLVICILLGAEQSLDFRDFKQLLDESDGNLGAQLRKLEDAGYLKVKKEFAERKPVTRYSLTRKGQHALEQHVDALHRLTQEFQV